MKIIKNMDNISLFIIEKMEFSYQDDGRTLKVFIGHENNKGVTKEDLDEFKSLKENITRFEVISDEKGREYTKWNIKSLEIEYDMDKNALNFYIK
jgi:hypothetical protein